MIQLTESAINAVERFMGNAKTTVAGLRILITGGGCSGFQYGLRLEETAKDDDTVVEFGSVKVLIDPISIPMLDGVNIDFVDSIEGSGFKFENPNASNACACGQSFSA